MKLKLLRLITLASALTSAASLRATVIDFEGIVPSQVSDILVNPSLTMGDFIIEEFGSNHGHVLNGSAFTSPTYANNGSDVYLHHSTAAFDLRRSDFGGFSLQSFDTADWVTADGAALYSINVTGFFVGGGSISTVVVTDQIAGFETFTLGAAWTNLSSVRFRDTAGTNGLYDNFVVDAPAVPDTASSIGLLGFSLAALVALRRRRMA